MEWDIDPQERRAASSTAALPHEVREQIRIRTGHMLACWARHGLDAQVSDAEQGRPRSHLPGVPSILLGSAQQEDKVDVQQPLNISFCNSQSPSFWQ